MWKRMGERTGDRGGKKEERRERGDGSVVWLYVCVVV